MLPVADTSSRGRLKIRLRDEQYVLATSLLGHTDDTARARFSGLSVWTVYRVRRGTTDVGETVIAQTLAALAPHRDHLARYNVGVGFDDLFEIVERSS